MSRNTSTIAVAAAKATGRLDPVVTRLVLGLLTSSLFLGSSLLWSLHAEPLVGGVSLFGAIGYTTACIMGVNLFRDIRYSEHPPEDM